MREGLLGDLRRIQALKVGDTLPHEMGPFAWAEFISKLCGEAADEIESMPPWTLPAWARAAVAKRASDTHDQTKDYVFP